MSLNVLLLSPQSEIPQTEESRYMLSVLVQQRSLLILQDDMYKIYLHGIRGVCEDILSEHVANLSSTGAQVGDTLPRSTRVSLTIRHVPKVIRANLLLGKKWDFQRLAWTVNQPNRFTPTKESGEMQIVYNILLYMQSIGVCKDILLQIPSGMYAAAFECTNTSTLSISSEKIKKCLFCNK